jgi:hypothetical protein
MASWAGAAPQHPGWAGVVLLPDWASAPYPGWAGILPRPLLGRRPVLLQHPGWVGILLRPANPAGPECLPRLGRLPPPAG